MCLRRWWLMTSLIGKMICIPMFAAAIGLLVWQMANPEGFDVIWSWFGWSNQTLAVFTLWAITVYLVRQHKNYFITLIPALFMTVVCSTFFFTEKVFKMESQWTLIVAVATLLISLIWFCVWYRKETKK